MLSVLLLALLATCATGAGSAKDQGRAAWVEFHNAGGFTGHSSQIRVEAAGSALSPEDHGRLFDLVSGFDFRALGAEYLTGDECCDRSSYLITVGYPTGDPKTVKTIDGAHSPPVVGAVIALLRPLAR